MDKVIIGIAYILTFYLFYNLIKVRVKKDENIRNRVYISITLIMTLIVIWNIFR